MRSSQRKYVGNAITLSCLAAPVLDSRVIVHVQSTNSPRLAAPRDFDDNFSYVTNTVQGHGGRRADRVFDFWNSRSTRGIFERYTVSSKSKHFTYHHPYSLATSRLKYFISRPSE